MTSQSYPKISIIIPTKDDAKGLEKCILSIKRQSYPQNKLEIIVVNDRSKDNTASIIRKYKAIYLDNIFDGNKTINRSEVGKSIGLHNAKGKYVYVLEQDIELVGNNFFEKLVYPLEADEKIVASFGREGVPSKKMTWVTKFISYHPIQCDPMYEYFSASINSRVVKKTKNYWILNYANFKIPPAGRMLFRTSVIKANESWNWPGFFDLDSVCALVKDGYHTFAYVPSAGIYHFHAKTLSHLVYKRVRNLHMHFFPYQETTYFKWFDVSNKKDIFKIIAWIIYANLIIPATIRGIYRAIKEKDSVLLAEPLITIATTDILVFNLIAAKDGQKLIYKMIRNLFHI